MPCGSKVNSRTVSAWIGTATAFSRSAVVMSAVQVKPGRTRRVSSSNPDWNSNYDFLTLKPGETVEGLASRMKPWFFDPDLDPIVTNKSPGPGKDILASSANRRPSREPNRISGADLPSPGQYSTPRSDSWPAPGASYRQTILPVSGSSATTVR